MTRSLAEWLREQCAEFEFAPAGVLQTDGVLDWPLVAASVDELIARLDVGGFLTPLPSESAALANVIEVAIVDFLLDRIQRHRAAGEHVSAERGAAGGYPDLEVAGDFFGGGYRAVDIKLARVKVPKQAAPTKTESRITLYTGNTYFRYPSIVLGSIKRPFDARSTRASRHRASCSANSTSGCVVTSSVLRQIERPVAFQYSSFKRRL